MDGKIQYQGIWGRLYITFAIIFALIFILGAFVLKDFTIALNILLCVMMYIIGNTMIKKPYAQYNEKEIIQYSFFGGVRKHHKFLNKSDISIKGNHFYLSNKKIKMNNWFVQNADWERAKKFYSGVNELEDELLN